MGLGSQLTDAFGEATGVGGSGNPRTHNVDDSAFEDYFNSAMQTLNSMGSKTQPERDQIQNSMRGMLADLENNAAGRKKHFSEDMSRSFGSNTQNRARAVGGTGNMLQAMSMPGGAYDSQARETARGYNDLYGQAVDDLGQLQGVQGNLFNQDSTKAGAMSNLYMQRVNQRLGVGMQAAENNFNAEQAGRERRMNTYSGAAKMAGGMFGGKG